MANLDQLSPADAASLTREDADDNLHVGAVALLEGPPPPWPQLREHVAERLHLVPRYRQRVVFPPVPLGGPAWTDDPSFNLDYHLRRSALPAPGDDEQLSRLVARIASQQLDRTKPLWELWCVEGLSGDRWAIVSKTHLALVDDTGGVDLVTVLFDREPDAGPGLDVTPSWVARPEPSAAQLAAAAVSSTARDLSTLPLRGFGVPGALRRLTEGVGTEVRARVAAAPDSPLNARVGPHRRVAFTRVALDDLRAVKERFGGTVNDVVLACVAGGIRALYHHRGRPVGRDELRACVPMSTSRHAEAGAPGNRIEPLIAPLPIAQPDPLERLRTVSAALADVRERSDAVAADALASLEDFAPPTILARAARVQLHPRLSNVTVTNVPGPQDPLFAVGRRLERVLPVPFLPAERALAVAAISYAGEVAFGLLADLDVLPDVGVVADGMRAALDELIALAVQ